MTHFQFKPLPIVLFARPSNRIPYFPPEIPFTLPGKLYRKFRDGYTPWEFTRVEHSKRLGQHLCKRARDAYGSTQMRRSRDIQKPDHQRILSRCTHHHFRKDEKVFLFLSPSLSPFLFFASALRKRTRQTKCPTQEIPQVVTTFHPILFPPHLPHLSPRPRRTNPYNPPRLLTISRNEIDHHDHMDKSSAQCRVVGGYDPS